MAKPGEAAPLTQADMKEQMRQQQADAIDPHIKVLQLRPEESFTMPRRTTEDDAGLDLTVSCWCVVHPGAIARLQSNVAIALPPRYYGLIVPRSSALSEKGLLVQTGVIDPGYRGELITVVKNPTSRIIQVNEGERLSQLLILAMKPFPLRLVVEGKLPTGSRGAAGFGSSGGYLGSEG